jgi:hypothetical protein
MSYFADYQLLPPLSAEEYEALKADIAEHGLQYPIIADEDGTVLDGHHRARICQELGISPPTEVRAGLSDEQKHDLALSLNLQRRHLTQTQKRELIRAEIERDPERSNRAIGRLLAVDHKTVAAVRVADRAEDEEPPDWLVALQALDEMQTADMAEFKDLQAASLRLKQDLPQPGDDISDEERIAALREIGVFVRWAGEYVNRCSRWRYRFHHWLWKGLVSVMPAYPELSSPRSLWRQLDLGWGMAEAEYLGQLPLELIEDYLNEVERENRSAGFDERPTLQGLRHFTYTRRHRGSD